MNSVNSKTEKNYTKSFIKAFVFSFFYFAQVKVHAIEVDLSRRQTDFTRIENQRMPASIASPDIGSQSDASIIENLKKIVNPIEPAQEIVILQTENGFVPAKINLRKDTPYTIHVVNLNEKEKNSSFLMDAFSQTHNTVYGNIKTFTVYPKVEGVYSYQSPETGTLGKVVVIGETVRKPATQDVAQKNQKRTDVDTNKKTVAPTSNETESLK